MKVVRTVEELRQWKKQHNTQRVGFVPTMGYLHEGHEALIKKAKEECDLVVTSIFVNPLQFNQGEDYLTYPRNEEWDTKRAGKAGTDLLFIPNGDEMYPQPMKSIITLKDGADALCGRSRPGHFDGVLTVVMKLFWMVLPTKAYFGLKDAQQVAVLESMVNEYHIPIDIVRIPTVREEDGLAKSSRNVNLTDQERMEAPTIYSSLIKMKDLLMQGEEIEKVITRFHDTISSTTSGTVDYIELRSFPGMETIETTEKMQTVNELILACAVSFSRARLIDNCLFKLEQMEEVK
ncbi:pantoate--beta-alanine ligase [Alteribacter aurantiacus]|uniref:pantoate--beta-alanine ligase n=1 Tax=Alteribacter aurantiacus TaxID=254410 RepID=UPI00040461F4|nr:pantoate--beta-alanine ligase [Alteribacter aurantiacus]